MLAKWVKVRVKPDMRRKFLEAIEVDAFAIDDIELRLSVTDQDHDADPNVYYFYEVYLNEDAVAAHRAAPHYAVWKSAADTLDGPIERIDCQSVFPSDPKYWTRNK